MDFSSPFGAVIENKQTLPAGWKFIDDLAPITWAPNRRDTRRGAINTEKSQCCICGTGIYFPLGEAGSDDQ